VAQWLAGETLNDVERRLLDSRSLDRGLFKTEAIQHLFAEHRARRRDHGNRIWRLLNLGIWHRRFMDGEKPRTAKEPRFPVSALVG
jgi:hypothetical protein